ncbi:YNL011C [Zygosaccharomyces parabailii]|nr:YNL011C [Zygosaccharomyces parabailii]
MVKMNLVVLSGGTASNALTDCFAKLSQDQDQELTYILPISDNGGSTSEILRVVGGPAIGDIRSRVAKLVGDPQVGQLLSYRLPNDNIKAKEEWISIVEGQHPVWQQIPTQVKEMCRAFIIHMQSELLKKTRSANAFRFEKASVGNFFLTGARLFLGSLDATVELLMRIGRCSPHCHIIPCISTNHTHHIAAILANGEIIRGQSQISHPSKPSPVQNQLPPSISEDGFGFSTKDATENENNVDSTSDEEQEEEFANPVYILPELKNSQLHFDKLDVGECFSAPIERLLYINPYGEEIKPTGNSRAVSKLKRADMVIYSIGSLVTSLLPIVILGNIADVIADAKDTYKVLLLNNMRDRESFWLDGLHYVQLVVDSMSRAVQTHKETKGSKDNTPLNLEWSNFVSDVVYTSKGEIQVDEHELKVRGIRCHCIESDKMESDSLEQVLKMISSLN